MPQPYAASEAWAGGHRGLAPRAPTNSCMDAPTKSGPGHTGKGAGPTAGGYENFHSKETSAPVDSWSIPMQSCAPYMGHCTLARLCRLQSPSRTAEPCATRVRSSRRLGSELIITSRRGYGRVSGMPPSGGSSPKSKLLQVSRACRNQRSSSQDGNVPGTS